MFYNIHWLLYIKINMASAVCQNPGLPNPGTSPASSWVFSGDYLQAWTEPPTLRDFEECFMMFQEKVHHLLIFTMFSSVSFHQRTWKTTKCRIVCKHLQSIPVPTGKYCTIENIIKHRMLHHCIMKGNIRRVWFTIWRPLLLVDYPAHSARCRHQLRPGSVQRHNDIIFQRLRTLWVTESCVRKMKLSIDFCWQWATLKHMSNCFRWSIHWI